MTRKAQAALEFLSTYGFAFVALAVVLGLISYLGIFNLSSLRNNECRLPPGFACQDFAFSQINPYAPAQPGIGTVTPGASVPNAGVRPYMRFIVTNTFGVNISVSQFNVTDDISHVNRQCGVVTQLGGPVYPWQPSENRTIYCNLSTLTLYYPRERYDGSFVVLFSQHGGAYVHNVTGHFSLVAQ